MEIKIHNDVEEFIKSLENQTVAKVLRTIDLLEQFGNRLGLPHSKGLGQGLFELRIRGQQEVRIFYIFYRNTVILLSGFVKKSNATPRHELKRALDKKAVLT